MGSGFKRSVVEVIGEVIWEVDERSVVEKRKIR